MGTLSPNFNPYQQKAVFVVKKSMHSSMRIISTAQIDTIGVLTYILVAMGFWLGF